MPIAKITGQGLLAMAFSVALLWVCLIGERVMVNRARQERVRLMQEIEQFHRKHSVPVSVPARLTPRVHTNAG
jgi:hypothetical protein